MAINKKKIFPTLIIIAVSGLFATCNKGEQINESYNYNFKAAWSVTTEQDSINIGDTLTIESVFTNHPFDYNTNMNIDFSGNALIGTPLTVRAIIGYNNAPPAIDSFQFIPLIGKCETDFQHSYIKQLFWQEINDSYQAKFQIIALKKGVYFITIVDPLAKNKNKSATVSLSNSNLNNNIYYLRTYFGGEVPNDQVKYSYCFKVK